jgi:hypothetical protein
MIHNQREMKNIHDKQKLKQYMTTKPALQKMKISIVTKGRE